MFGSNKIKQEFSEKYLENTKKNRHRYMILVMIITVIIYAITLSFLAGFIGKDYTDFNAANSLTISGLLSLITGIVGFFFGVEVGKKPDKKDVKPETISVV
jgi:putative Mn2+ efflux pump MntP